MCKYIRVQHPSCPSRRGQLVVAERLGRSTHGEAEGRDSNAKTTAQGASLVSNRKMLAGMKEIGSNPFSQRNKVAITKGVCLVARRMFGWLFVVVAGGSGAVVEGNNTWR